MLYQSPSSKTELSNVEESIDSHWEKSLNLMYIEKTFVSVRSSAFECFFLTFTDKRKAFS